MYRTAEGTLEEVDERTVLMIKRRVVLLLDEAKRKCPWLLVSDTDLAVYSPFTAPRW